MGNRAARSLGGSLATIGVDDLLDGYPTRGRTAIHPSKQSHLALPNPHPQKSRTASMDDGRCLSTITEGREPEDNSRGGPFRPAPGPTTQRPPGNPGWMAQTSPAPSTQPCGPNRWRSFSAGYSDRANPATPGRQAYHGTLFHDSQSIEFLTRLSVIALSFIFYL